MAELEIPDVAYEAGEGALGGYPIADTDMLDAASEVLQAAARLVVAAELRRLADEFDEELVYGADEFERAHHAGMQRVVRSLRRRADGLDPPTTDEGSQR